MEVSKGTFKIITIVLGIILLLAIAFGVYQRVKYQSMIQHLTQDVAAKDKTIEVQKNVYEKVIAENTNLKDLLSSKDEEQKKLVDQLKIEKQKLATVTNIAVKWKKAYEGAAGANQSDAPSSEPGKPVRKRVEFKRSFDYLTVDGWTLTDPAEAWVHVDQNRPLRLTVAVTEGPKGEWKVFTTSSEENVQLDIGLSAVNPILFSPKWYERIQVKADLGIGDGVLMGVGAQYKIKQFDVGPSVWMTIGNELDSFIGMSMTWYPFERIK